MLNGNKNAFHQHVKDLQKLITIELQKADPEIELTEDLWAKRDFDGNPGGGGITRAFRGKLIENAGVNTSCVFGTIDPKFANTLPGEGNEIWAAGISLIIHPRNPRIPTTHANFRMIERGGFYWFGGGADLTPYYPHEEDFHHFHSVWKKAAGPDYQPMKDWCDEYFTNQHRGDMRGIGGIFFDQLNTGNFQSDYSQVVDLSKYFIESYLPIVQKRSSEAWTDEDEKFMLHRRGRYVEFNLLHDRGTIFGLRTGGRTESILISLPERCLFEYGYKPRPGSPQEKMLAYYRPRSW